jgi:hypothetical protein
VAAYFDCRRTSATPKRARLRADLERNLVGALRRARRRHATGRAVDLLRRHAPEAARGLGGRLPRSHRPPPALQPHRRRASSARSSPTAAPASRAAARSTRRAPRAKVRSVTRNWSAAAWYLKCDVANFFVAIDKRDPGELLARAHPRAVVARSRRADPLPRSARTSRCAAAPEALALVPPHKRCWPTSRRTSACRSATCRASSSRTSTSTPRPVRQARPARAPLRPLRRRLRAAARVARLAERRARARSRRSCRASWASPQSLEDDPAAGRARHRLRRPGDQAVAPHDPPAHLSRCAA